jgi:amino acid adenylation domain-containing protein
MGLTVARIEKQFRTLLKEITDNPDRMLRNLPLAEKSEWIIDPTETLACEWEGAAHVRFCEQASRTPHRVAVRDETDQWTYSELDRRSNQLARFLLAHGIQIGDFVAIYGHRSASLVWAILGILKSGAAFLILDPAYPPARLTEFLRIAKPKGWLQIEAAGDPGKELGECVKALTGNCRLTLPGFSAATERGFLNDYSEEDPRIPIDPDGCAYVALTSGTTGAPKGIVGTHRPLSHFLQWHCREFDLQSSDRFSMLSGLSHDPLLRDVFTPLWLGATLYIPAPEEIASPGLLSEWMKRYGISVSHLTPAMGSVLTQTVERGTIEQEKGITFPSLRYAFFGGDVLTRRDVANLRRLAPSVACVNFYGTTETPQAIAYCRVINDGCKSFDDDPKLVSEVIPLGRGIIDVQLLVLSAPGNLASVGELGEICVRTPYLAKGYLTDEALTRERFIPNPFTNRPGDRLYRTGDLGRYLADGRVMFCGRADRQVSVRGFRVELGEIEFQLGELDAISNEVVELREDHLGGKRLVAYYVVKSGCDISISNLRKHLHSKLPDYMVPQHFLRLESIPISPNGKINRNALPRPDFEKITENKYEAPRTEMEQKIAAIWQEVLKHKNVGIHDDFFELGGHSLLATQVLSRINQSLDIKLPLRKLFEARTIEAMAQLIETFFWSTEGREELRAVQNEDREVLDL